MHTTRTGLTHRGVFFPDRERVRKQSFRLKGTPFSISEQFPKEVLETRHKLVPIMKKAREDKKGVYITVDTLFSTAESTSMTIRTPVRMCSSLYSGTMKALLYQCVLPVSLLIFYLNITLSV